MKLSTFSAIISHSWITYPESKFFFLCRPEILKQEIKVFFVKYNDPIYVKLEKLDIMIRLASQANIAQVHHMKSSYRNHYYEDIYVLSV